MLCRRGLFFVIVYVGVLFSSMCASNVIPGDSQCDVCIHVVTALKTSIGNPYNQGQIEAAIKASVCTELGSVQLVCNQYVDQYLGALLTKVSADLQPHQMCIVLTFCIGLANAKPAIKSQHPVMQLQSLLRKPKAMSPFSALSCVKCRAMIQGARQWQQRSEDGARWLKLMRSAVCNIQASDKRSACLQDFDRQYRGIIPHLVFSHLDTLSVCNTLGACNVGTKLLNEPKVATAALTPPDNACVICKTAVQYAKLLLKDNGTQQQIMQMLEKVCLFVPGQPQLVCRSMVEQLGSLVFQMLENDAGPLLICQTLHFCPNSRKPPSASHQNRQAPPNNQALRFAKLTPGRDIVEFIVKKAAAGDDIRDGVPIF